MGISDFFKKPSIADLQARGDVDHIVKILLAKDGKRSMETAGALAEMVGEKVVLALLQAAMHSNPNVRVAGSYMLAMVGDPTALSILLKITTDKSLPTPVRGMAVNSVGSIKKREALEPLIMLLDDSETELRVSAAYALKFRDSR